MATRKPSPPATAPASAAAPSPAVATATTPPPAARSGPAAAADGLPPIGSYLCAQVQPDTRVSKHFTVRELTVSDLAKRRGIDNRFDTDAHLQAGVHLARAVLDVLREHFGKPYSPNSVFRSQAVERALKDKPGSWISTSQHTLGCACDVEIPGTSTLDLATWAADNLTAFDQIICECYDPAEGANSGWVHISVLAPGMGVNRREKLSYVRDPANGRYVYVKGFRAA